MSTSSKITYLKDILVEGTVLPQTSASLSQKVNLVEDTNGLTSHGYKTRLGGLLTTGINANGFLGSNAGYLSTIKIAGNSTTLTDEACSAVGVSTTLFQITSSSKRVLDPAVSITVSDGGTPVSADGYEIDYMLGRITFDSAPGGAVTLSGAYFPMTAVAEAKGFTLDMKGDVLDATDYATAQGNGGQTVNRIGLIDISLKLDRFALLATSGDIEQLLNARTPKIIEIGPQNGLFLTRGWYVFGAVDFSGDISGQEMEAVEASLYGHATQNFGWLASASMNAGLSACITAFLNRTDVAVQYLPDGAAGRTADMYVSQFSIAGDLAGVDKWNASFVPAGALSNV